MNILLLHGNRQEKSLFQKLFKDYEKLLTKQQYHCIYLEGFYRHSEIGSMWYEEQIELEDIGQDSISLKNIHTSINQLHQIILTHQIHYLIGFSQGANLIDTYLRLHQEVSIQKVLLFNGYSFPQFKSLIPQVDSLIFVTSDEDDIVSTDKLILNYSNYLQINHSYGHKIGLKTKEIKNIIENFINC